MAEVPETPEDPWRALAIDSAALISPDVSYPASEWITKADALDKRLAALLAAEDEHPATPTPAEHDEAVRQIANVMRSALVTDTNEYTAARIASVLGVPAAPVDEHPPTPEGWPNGMDMVRQLREAVGLFAGAMSISPQLAWNEAIDRARHQADPPARADRVAEVLGYRLGLANDAADMLERLDNFPETGKWRGDLIGDRIVVANGLHSIQRWADGRWIMNGNWNEGYSSTSPVDAIDQLLEKLGAST